MIPLRPIRVLARAQARASRKTIADEGVVVVLG